MQFRTYKINHKKFCIVCKLINEICRFVFIFSYYYYQSRLKVIPLVRKVGCNIFLVVFR